MGVKNRERRKEKRRRRCRKRLSSTPPKRREPDWKYADGKWWPLTRRAERGLVPPPDSKGIEEAARGNS